MLLALFRALIARRKAAHVWVPAIDIRNGDVAAALGIYSRS